MLKSPPFTGLKIAAYRHLPYPQLGNWAYRRAHRSVHPGWREAPFFLLHVPKCAGTSIVGAMELPDPGHLLVDELDEQSREMLKGKHALIVVRDPIERIVSTFTYAHTQLANSKPSHLLHATKYQDVNEWIARYLRSYIELPHYFFLPSTTYIESAIANDMTVHVAPIENLQPSLDALSRITESPSLELPVSNKSRSFPSLKTKVSCETADLVKRYYSSDAQLHKFVKARGMCDPRELLV